MVKLHFQGKWSAELKAIRFWFCELGLKYLDLVKLEKLDFPFKKQHMYMEM